MNSVILKKLFFEDFDTFWSSVCHHDVCKMQNGLEQWFDWQGTVCTKWAKNERNSFDKSVSYDVSLAYSGAKNEFARFDF